MSYRYDSAPPPPVERKAWGALFGGIFAGGALAIVNEVSDTVNRNAGIFDVLPAPVRFIVVTLAPGALAFAGAWLTRHTNRVDPAAREPGGSGT